MVKVFWLVKAEITDFVIFKRGKLMQKKKEIANA
jgi:hypothetical protein